MAPNNESELEEILTAPTPETIEAIRQMRGDLLILGAGGKMGPSLARLAHRSAQAAGGKPKVLCASRFSAPGLARTLARQGIDCIACDLLDREALARLPDAPNVLYLAGMKFGTSEAPSMTWALNCLLPALVAERFRASRIVALSTGNVYPFVPVDSGGATEQTPTGPVGEYAQSCLGRERMFEFMASRHGTRVLLVRLNYANDLRYGVLLDVAQKVYRREPIDLSMGFFNAIWQGDANAVLLRAFSLCSNPPDILNLTGPASISVRELAQRFAARFEAPPPAFVGVETPTALLSNASRCHALFGLPRVSLHTMVEWTARWVQIGGATLRKPTHYEAQDGRF
jgi:nucleoside-diphosphate-sugar epimerase